MDKLLLSLIGSKKKFFEKFDSCVSHASDYFVVYDDSGETPRYSLGYFCFSDLEEGVYFHVRFSSCYFGNFWKRVVKRNSFSDGTYVVVSKEVLDSFRFSLNYLLWSR